MQQWNDEQRPTSVQLQQPHSQVTNNQHDVDNSHGQLRQYLGNLRQYMHFTCPMIDYHLINPHHHGTMYFLPHSV